jgi:hypothetical protein
MNTLPLTIDPRVARLLKLKQRVRHAQLAPGAAPSDAPPRGWWVLDEA